MIEWWEGLPALGQIFAGMAIPATVIMLLQSVLLLFGLGFGGDAGADGHADVCDSHDCGGHDAHDGHGGDFHEGDGLSLFTIRGIVAFFSVGGWTGLACVVGGMGPVLAGVIAFVAGAAALLGIALLFKYALKLQDRGNLDIRNAIGKTGTVYLPVPPRRQSAGKVTVLFQQRLVEVDAVTDDSSPLKTGEMAMVVGIIGENTVLVRAISPEQGNAVSEDDKGGISKWIR